VVVATVGTKLYDGDKELEIKKSKIRGEVSEGMICAEDEIGLGKSHEGIMVLDQNAIIGQPAKEYFDIYSDIVLEVDITPNRPDAISHFGIARDLFAFLSINSDLKLELKLPKVDDFKIQNTNKNIEIEIKNTEACPRYSGISLSNVNISESPTWMQNRLKAIGLKPINNVVDITNYVLHEIGHPLHAFDANIISGNKIIVSTVTVGTKFTMLDEKETELTDNDLMICDSNLTPLCMGGVMGGLNSGITENTKTVFLESAFFNPVWVRKTAKSRGISSDSSYRFERGVDPNNCIWTLKRCALMIKEIAGAEISSEIKDIYPEKINNFKVDLTFKQLDKYAGFVIDRELINKILNLLEINIIEQNEIGYKLEVPTYRFEVRREADVIEDIIRIYGYNRLPISDSLTTKILVQEESPNEEMKLKIGSFLTSLGFFEMISFSLLNGEIYEKLSDFDSSLSVKMQNPLSKELDTMRQSLIFGALDAVNRNINNNTSVIKLYELGSTYIKTNASNFDDKYVQSYRLSLTLSGKTEKENWKTDVKNIDFYNLKSSAEAVLKRLGFSIEKFKTFEISDNTYKYGLEYKLGKDTVMKIGSVARQVLKIYDIDQEVFFAEIEWGLLISRLSKPQNFSEIVKFPKVKRDLALLIDKAVKYADIEKLAFDVEKVLLKEVNIFDVYEGDKLPEGKKSYAVSFYLQSNENTLTDKNIETVMEKLIFNFKNKLGAEIR
jgi:phenylalanyl-tRNA synthetase beta chain